VARKDREIPNVGKANNFTYAFIISMLLYLHFAGLCVIFSMFIVAKVDVTGFQQNRKAHMQSVENELL
jgi:hypothetical protein